MAEERVGAEVRARGGGNVAWMASVKLIESKKIKDDEGHF